MIGDFHFIRPWWPIALIPCVLIILAIRRREDVTRQWRGIVAPHLLPFLLHGEEKRGRFQPWMLIAVGWAVTVVAIAGPTWRREPAPFADDTAALAIVVKVSPSMMTEDVQPGRLSRGVQKIHDLLEKRKGAKTALIAYSGTAHVVMPATTDEGIVDTFAAALDPKIMPGDGDAAAEALKLADKALADAGSGSILWITDGVAPETQAALAKWRKESRTEVRLLPALLPGDEMKALQQSAGLVNASVVTLAADDSDVAELARAAKFATSTAAGASDRWQESGYWLTPLMALGMLPFFRRGWMVRSANRSN
jgi:Ca-activated chloride channel family protein